MATMTYGSYSFDPVPLISITIESVVDEAENRLYDEVTIGCNGTLVNSAGDFGKMDKAYYAPLVSGVADDFQELIITHQSGVFVSGVYPRVTDVSFDESVWVNKVNYSFAFVYQNNIASGIALSGVKDYSDTWDWGEGDDDTASLTHSVSAVGLNTNPSGVNNSLDNAKAFVTDRLGGLNPVAKIPGGGPSLIFSSYSSLSYIRGLLSEALDKAGGSYSVTENYVAASGASLNYLHRNTFDVSVDPNGIAAISVTGGIQGNAATPFERNNKAMSGWLNDVRPTLFTSASSFHAAMGRTRILGSGYLSESVTRNHNAGTVDYSASWDDKLNDASASGVIDADYSISEQRPIDAFASIQVPGKATGPVWQNLGTTTEGQYQLSGQVIGETIERAKAYAQHIINTYGGQSKGNVSRITSFSFDPDNQANSISFNVTWTYTGDGATSTIP